MYDAIVACVLVAAMTWPSRVVSLKTFAFEDLIPAKEELTSQNIGGRWISEKKFLALIDGNVVFDYDTGKTETLLSEEVANNLDVSAYGTGQYLVITEADDSHRTVYEQNTESNVYSIYDVKNNKTYPLGSKKRIQAFENVGSVRPESLAFVSENNVYYVPNVTEPDSIVALTTDGVPNIVFNGIPDDQFQNDYSNEQKDLSFSPGATHLYIGKYDATYVDDVYFNVYGEPSDLDFQYSILRKRKYAKPGRNISKASIVVFPLTGDKKYKPIVLPVPTDVVGEVYVVGDVAWASETELVAMWLNRRQNVSLIVKCDVTTVTCENKIFLNETRGWLQYGIGLLLDSTGELMVSIQPMETGGDRHFHAVRTNLTDLSTQDLSPGNITVTNLLAWHWESDTVFFYASSRSAPWETRLWRNSKGKAECVTCSKKSCEFADTIFNDNASLVTILCSSANTPEHSYIYNTVTKAMTPFRNNSKLTETLKEYAMPTYEFSVETLPSGNPLHLKMILPPNLNTSQKYPMLLNVYSAPGYTIVNSAFELGFDQYLTSNRSYVVCYLDVRGSGVMGVNATFASNLALGTVEIDDALEAIQFLVKKYNYIDGSRVGVWGASYGGYASAMMLAHDTKKLLRCAAAVSPPTSWIHFSAEFTEPLMDTPQNNPEGYAKADLLQQVKGFAGRPFLLLQGSADTNVQLQHSMMLAKAMQRENIEFDEMIYTDEYHNLESSEVNPHFYHKVDHFFTECFSNDK